MTWTEEAIDELKRLHSGGLFSSEEIAMRLTAELRHTMTRNAVIGKVHRLGLKNGRTRGNYETRPRKPRGERSDTFRPKKLRLGDRGWQAGPKFIELVEPEPILDEAIPLSQRKTLMQLDPGDCRFPCGDPVDPGFFFCGGPSVEGGSYCPEHTRRAYQTKRGYALPRAYVAQMDRRGV